MGKNIIDIQTLGYRIRQARTEAGYATAEDFANAITEQTGVPVSKQTIYNIESGKQEPRLTLYLAMLRLLHPDEQLPIDEMLRSTLPPRWRIPLNAAQAIEALQDADASETADEAANDAHGEDDGTMHRKLTIDDAAKTYDAINAMAMNTLYNANVQNAISEITKNIGTYLMQSGMQDTLHKSLSQISSSMSKLALGNMAKALESADTPGNRTDGAKDKK
ncbi:hypothetical protein PSRA_0103 [Pseudoscardovia radai]|uniref:Uncharacterized protein n=3 Tax=Pseudoscardovia radai TaxID=987066 RepID=A0A261F2Z8_9BIFI|nr:hypothetical protein [Pseudoscardovia radai]OZG53296.1 hypothetical protein PSRA_0103 [Pseudoscardovia radai]